MNFISFNFKYLSQWSNDRKCVWHWCSCVLKLIWTLAGHRYVVLIFETLYSKRNYQYPKIDILTTHFGIYRVSFARSDNYIAVCRKLTKSYLRSDKPAVCFLFHFEKKIRTAFTKMYLPDIPLEVIIAAK